MKVKPNEKEITVPKSKVTEPKVRFRDHPSHKIPKIFDKEIPLHNFGMQFQLFSPPKDIRIRSKIWSFQNRREVKSSEPATRKNYNRPVYLLRGYLQRKDKYAYQPVITNPESESHLNHNEQHTKELSRTLNDFRIKKTQKRNFHGSDHFALKQNEQIMQTTQIDKTDKDFSTFNSKNLYEMTLDELQESIEWKKKFLDLINRKRDRINRARNTSYLNQF